MGLWDLIRRRTGSAPKKRSRISAAEKEKALEVRYLNDLKNRNRPKFDEIMQKRLGVHGDSDDSFEQLETMVTRLKKMEKLIKNPNDTSGEGNSWIRDAIAGVGMFIQMQQQQAQSPAPVVTSNPDPVGIANTLPPRYAQQQLPQPQPEQQEEQMSLIAQFIIGQLQNKTPLDAAHWLIDQPYPQAKQLVAQLVATPDDQLPQFLATIAQSAPDFAPLVNWLRSRPKWFVDTVHAIREIVQPQQATKGDLGL